MKKIIKSIMCCIFAISLIIVPAYADITNVESYSTEEIKRLTEERMKSELGNQFNNSTIRPMAAYTETPISFDLYTNVLKYDCFEVGKVTFDTTGNPIDYNLDVTFNTMESVEWTFSGTVSGETEATLFNLIKAKITVSASVARASASSSNLGVNVSLIVPPNSVGEIPLYAHGYVVQGKMKYSWYDGHTGQSGYRYENTSACIPYAKYSSATIHIAPMRYSMWNGVLH